MAPKTLILVPLLVAASCSGKGPAINDQAPSEPVGRDGAASEQAAKGAGTGVRLARLPESRMGDAAAAVGTLRAEGACLYLEAAGSTRYLIASTIPGARWDAARAALIVPSERAGVGAAATYRPGDRVTLGGSAAHAATLAGQWIDPPAETCDTARIWITNSIVPAGND